MRPRTIEFWADSDDFLLGVEGTGRDISLGGGMFIETDMPCRFGERTVVRVTLHGSRHEMALAGVIRWTCAAGIGVQFGRLGARETHEITEFTKGWRGAVDPKRTSYSAPSFRHPGAVVFSGMGAMQTPEPVGSDPREGSGVAEAQPPQAGPPPLKKKLPHPARILIVDDDVGFARALKRALRDCAAAVQTSVSAQHALDRIVTGECFDLILSDVTMPLMSGCDLYDEVRRFAPEQADRMVFVTGGSGDKRTERALAATGRPVLAKPFKPAELRTFVEKFLG